MFWFNLWPNELIVINRRFLILNFICNHCWVREVYNESLVKILNLGLSSTKNGLKSHKITETHWKAFPWRRNVGCCKRTRPSIWCWWLPIIFLRDLGIFSKLTFYLFCRNYILPTLSLNSLTFHQHHLRCSYIRFGWENRKPKNSIMG